MRKNLKIKIKNFQAEFYYGRSWLNENFDDKDLKDRKKLREKLNCKSFQWYLDEIYPELKTKMILMNKN